MVAAQWRVKPAISGSTDGILVGPSGQGFQGDRLLLGRLAEAGSGRGPRIWLATDKEQVIAVVGKRGSGKSFTLGVVIEGLATRDTDTVIARQMRRRGLVVFDPLDVYWPSRFPVEDSGNPEAAQHFRIAKRDGFTGLSVDVEAWIPGAQFCRPADPDWFGTFQVAVPELGLDEWALLLNVNMLSEPVGQGCADALSLVRTGYSVSGTAVPAKVVFGIEQVVDATRSDQLEPGYHRETLRALRQRLSSLGSSGLFSATGTRISDLVKPGSAAIVLLGRLPENYRNAVVAIVTRQIIDARSRGAFAEKRLALDPSLTIEERTDLEALMVESIPRTVVALDEAQNFLAPDSGGPARDLFVRLVKEGRNLGLSTVVATQQPSAMDQRVLSQVETFIAHQLVTDADIRAVKTNLKASLPESIAFGPATLDFSALMRQLGAGQCLVSAADLLASPRRSFLATVRPRATVHGGIEL
jgi:hypothetical protein